MNKIFQVGLPNRQGAEQAQSGHVASKTGLKYDQVWQSLQGKTVNHDSNVYAI
jgi:hypothetical protein